MPDATPSLTGNVRQVYRRGSRPIPIEPAKLNMPVKARPWPVTRFRRQSMFDRIEVDVIAVAKPVRFVAYAVFPVPSLPNTPLAMSCSVRGNWQRTTASRQKLLGEQAFDVRPSNRKVVVAVRQRPEAVQVVRQEHAGEHIEGPTSAHRHKCPPQRAASAGILKEFPTAMRHHREKIGRTILAPSDVIWHVEMVSTQHG